MFFTYGEKEIKHLMKRDKKLAQAIDRIGMIERILTPDLFSALIQFIVEQQISIKAARTVNGRLYEKLGELTPNSILKTSAEEIQSCGMSMKKAGYIKGVAEAALDGRLDLTVLNQCSDEDAIKLLSALNGVGVWTAEMLLIASLSRPNILSWGDLAIRRGMMNLYGHKTLPRERFERYRKRYSPYCTTASLYLWVISTQGGS